MLDFKGLVLDSQATVGTELYLKEVSEYQDKEESGYKYKVISPRLDGEPVNVKIPGKKLIDKNDRNEVIHVAFENLEVWPYAFVNAKGRLLKGLSGKATSIKKVN